ncbi:MAG: NfeD family protein [Spirochaetia bacterium]|nr:NfeD family protein [Spirochaetia bacterium]
MIEFLMCHLFWFWFGVLVLAVIIEAMTVGLVTIWSAISAFVLIFISLTGLVFSLQVVIFVVLNVLLILFTRSFFMRKLKVGKYRTNADSLVGKNVLVSGRITEFDKGTVKASNGVIWNAMAADGKVLEIGTKCVVVDIEGNTLIVKEY